MKTKYERMSRLEKKELYKKYKEEKSIFVNKMEKMFLFCYIGLGYSVIIFIYDFFFKKSKVNYIIDIVLFVFCLIAFLKIYNTKKELLNNYALKKDRENKKKIAIKYKK